MLLRTLICYSPAPPPPAPVQMDGGSDEATGSTIAQRSRCPRAVRNWERLSSQKFQKTPAWLSQGKASHRLSCITHTAKSPFASSRFLGEHPKRPRLARRVVKLQLTNWSNELGTHRLSRKKNEALINSDKEKPDLAHFCFKPWPAAITSDYNCPPSWANLSLLVRMMGGGVQEH